jgi:hypothetical protein
MRGRLAEEGLGLPTGGNALRKAWAEALAAAHATLTPRRPALVGTRRKAVKKVDAEGGDDDETRQALATTYPESHRRWTLPGIGPRTATALSPAGGAGGGVTVQVVKT